MSALVATISLSVKDLEAVRNLIAETDMAVQLLSSGAGIDPDMVGAIREGLESALEQLRA